MSLRINVKEVIGVLVAGRWYEVTGFDLDAWEFELDEGMVNQDDLTDRLGFVCIVSDSDLMGDVLMGPVSSIQAVRLA